MKITLNAPKEIVLVPQKTVVVPGKTKTITEVKILSMLDLPEQKKVIVNTLELGSFELWTGSAYDAAGQWTDNDVKNAIITKYSLGGTASNGGGTASNGGGTASNGG